MDTGHVQHLDQRARREVMGLARTASQGRPFVVGAPPADGPGDLVARYRNEAFAIAEAGGTPILFPSPELAQLAEPEVVALHAEVTRDLPSCLAFELGKDFVPWGRIYQISTVAALMEIPGLQGMKHSSLDRQMEWQRLALRDELRPDFRVYTGNDLAIDMIMYGSDYLLGLAAFHPEAFALRDKLWQRGHSGFHELNDALQALGSFAFRKPVPAYRANAAQYLHLRGVIPHAGIPAGAATRPESDREILSELEAQITGFMRRFADEVAP
jgi:dihydrodipicolinate synthase/N-acetylneuraminate lyase